MSRIEVRKVTPEEMIGEIEASVRLQRENKYVFQVGLKDVDFDVDQAQLETQGLKLPFSTIPQAEQALAKRVIVPVMFLEYDNTNHEVIEFDPTPIGYSGFMGCVTHSLALTDKGLFEVGHYPAMDLSSTNRYWQWFLHRRLATTEEIHSIQEMYGWDHKELMSSVIAALTGQNESD